MKQLLKEDIVLVTGIVLPLLLAGLFWISKTVSLAGIKPPVTQVVYLSGVTEDPEYPWAVEVREGKLHVLYNGTDDKGEQKRYWSAPRIFIFNPVDNIVRPVALPRPPRESGAVAGAYDLVPDALKDKTLSVEELSPDGYIFTRNDDGGHYSGGFVTEIFGGDRRSSRFSLQKDNYRRGVPSSDYNSRFVGWIVP